MSTNDTSPLTGVVVVAVVLLVVFGGLGVILSYKQVPEGHVGVEKEWGAVTGTQYDSGPHWIVPVQDGVQHIEVRPRTYTSSVDVTTLNGTTFNVSYTIRYRVNRDEASKFVEQWNNIGQFEQRLIDPTVEDRMRKEGAGIQSSVVYTQEGRQELTVAAEEKLLEQFSDEAAVLEAVQVTNVGIPRDYQSALNDKEIAKQQVQKEQYNVQVERKKAEQKEIQAEADARVIEIKGEALRDNPIVLRQRYIDAIDSTDKVIIGGSDGSNIILDATGESTNSTSGPSGPGGN